MAERIWQMRRVCSGDYLLVSNDRTTVWRLYRYWEDGSATVGSGDGERKLISWFWGAACRPMPAPHVLGDLDEDFLSWHNGGWITVADTLRTREDAVREAESTFAEEAP